ncbi:MAG: CoA-binding protein, partial [Planctomycetes bacterium]|nr:CoA-binding protein [Planctomycetota bacterium]
MAVLDWTIKEKIGLSKMVGLGNKVVVDEISLLKYLGDDPNTTCILAYLEGINHGREFMEVARKVSRTKPIVMLKGGTTDAGARAVSSHTGSLAGKDIAYQSAFLQSGIIRVQNIQDMFDLAEVFERYANIPVLKGSNLAIVTNSGGPAVLAADRIAKSQSLKMSFFTEPTIDTLRKALPPGAGIYNPVDVIADANRERYSTTLNTVLADKNVDGVLVIFTPASQEQPEFVAQVTGQMFKKSTKPIITSFMGGEMAQIAVKLLEELGVPNYPTPERAIAAFEAMRQYEIWKAKSKRIEQIKPINSTTKNNINRLIREPLTT